MSGPPPAYQPVDLPRAQKVAAMVASVMGIFLAALDQTVVATAGPIMQTDLHIAQSLYVWMTTSYVVASTVMVPLWGKLSDLFGRKRTLLIGMTLFLVGSALCASATSFNALIAYRVLQGIGSAALFTNAFAVTADLFAPSERGKYQGFFGGMFGLASVIGPYVGGFLTDHLSWHWVFLINLPLGAIALGVAMAKMPPLRRPRSGPLFIDVPGATLIMIAMVPLLLAFSLGKAAAQLGPHAPPMPGWPWGSWQILGMFAIAAIGVIGFIVAERRARDPLLDLRLFRQREFWHGNLAAFTVGLPFISTIVFLPQFMVNVAGASASEAGTTLIPLTLGIVAANILSGQIVSRVGKYKPVLLAALVAQIVGFALMGWTLTSTSSQLEVSLKMIILGIGMGPAIPLFTLAVQSSVPLNQIGVATSTAVFARSVGATLGAGILSSVLAIVLAGGAMGAHGPSAEAWTHATRVLFQVSAGIALFGLLVTLSLPAVPLRKAPGAPVAME